MRDIDITHESVTTILAGCKASLARCEEDAVDYDAERTAEYLRQAQTYIGMAEATWRKKE